MFAEYSDLVLWSIGPCGEDPRPIAADVTSTFHDERWPDVLLGCREAQRDIVSLDPAGAAPPHVVFTDIDCDGIIRTSQGYVTVDWNFPRVNLHPSPDDPRSETSAPRSVLGPSTTPMYPSWTGFGAVSVRGDAVFVGEGDGTLVRVDLADMSETVEQTGVVTYALSPDARYLLWQGINPVGEPTDLPGGVVCLRDRTTGDGQALARTALEYEPTPFALSEHG